MSITLMAYPMAFLIEPEKAKNEKIKLASESGAINDAVRKTSNSVNVASKLKSIRIITNIKYDELTRFMSGVDCAKVGNDLQYIYSGINVKWDVKGKYVVANIYGQVGASSLQYAGEDLFVNIDRIAGRNTRLVDSNEYFYYNYETSYTSETQIYSELKQQGASQIFSTEEGHVVAELNGQPIKYFKNPKEKTYTLEVEQKVKILNIGMKGEVEGTNVTFGLTNLRIKTNIRPEELRTLLKKSNYLFYEADCQTPLKNSNATLNWILKDGYYIAEFSGNNNVAITKEAEIIFKKMNIASGRDLRLINDVSTTVYTYKTNYTDKGTLLNTLLEHGAEEIVEKDDEISCKLFGMEMIYYKKDNSAGYTLDITQVSDKSACEDIINDLNEEYGLNIQEMTYNKIKDRLEKENLRLESEAVMEDNSIILTIDV